MKSIIIIIILLTPQILFAELHSVEEWAARYLSPCPKIPNNRVCYSKTKRNFKRMLKYKKLLFKHLDRFGLPHWLATIPFIESEFVNKTPSKAGAIGLWQIMPYNLQYYLTKTRGPINGYFVITKPTIQKAKKLGEDPKINTEIACKMLKHLYEKYGKGNDETVVRAYNAGETRINKSLKGIGKPLKHETLNYYPQLMALQQLINGYDDYFE